MLQLMKATIRITQRLDDDTASVKH